MWQCLVFCIIFFLNLQITFSSSFYSSPASTRTKLCSPEQSLALLQFKNAISVNRHASNYCNASAYPKTNFWREESDCCSWDGVTCDRLSGDVIGLDLSSSWLRGTIDDNSSLFLLHHLQRLNLACNDFRKSKISSKFGWFTKLTHLNFSSTLFSGQVPSEISHLSMLVSLDLSENNLHAIELTHHGFNKLLQNLTELRYLHLDGVNMSSVAPVSLVNLSSYLISLTLRENALYGQFPDEVFRLPFLQRLRLSDNEDLTGNLPTSNWSNPIRLLDLSSTGLSGKLPAIIGNLIHLNELDLSHCNFEGSIPTSLWNLAGITSLVLSSNNFTGQIPASISKLYQLTHLNLEVNSFSGALPDDMGNLSKLTDIFLFDNNFYGQLPSSVFNLTNLSQLDFSHNQLEGHFPYHIVGLPYLIELHLSHNNLSGRTPSWLFSLPALEHLDLSNNKFTGSFDKFQQLGPMNYVDFRNKSMNLSHLDLSSNNLSGIVKLDMLSKLKNLEYVDLSHNNLLSLRSHDNINFTLPMLQSFHFSSCNNLTKFPIFLRNFRNLQSLDLSNNGIPGRISRRDLESWEYLAYLNLSHNFLVSLEEIPSMRLEFLDIHSNLLQGLPVIQSRGMRLLSVSDNKLIGEIPTWFCNFSYGYVLDLSNNSLSGMIPQCLLNNFGIVDLRMNNFKGSIPQACEGNIQLLTLNLNGNQLEGTLPPSLVNCSFLEVLDVGNNKIKDTFPHWLATLPKLEVLILRSNRFYGPINDSKRSFRFHKLRILDLSHNGFTGLLPTRYFQRFEGMTHRENSLVGIEYMGNDYYQYSVILTMKGIDIEMVRVLTIFTTVDLSNNQFQGRIPKIVGKLNSLKVLNFSHNNLTGRIPSSLENLTELESLDLSANKLLGEIPIQLTNLKSLSVLNLSYNQLVGPIPQGNQFNTFENNSYIGNLGLCGLPLSETCDNDKAVEPAPSIFPEEYNTSSFFDWKIIMMGYASGLVIGFSIGYIVISIGKPQWLIRVVERAQLIMMRRVKKFIG